MITLFFDTETSGKVNFKAPLISALQPHLLQLGMELVENEQVRASVSILVDPGPTIEIPAEVVKIHGLSREVVGRLGIPSKAAVGLFHTLARVADRFVCHNTQFDLAIIEMAYYRAGRQEAFLEVQGKPKVCTMRTATPVLKLPGNYGFKLPTLDEAYRLLVDEAGFAGAHDALADVRACRAVLTKLEEMGVQLCG